MSNYIYKNGELFHAKQYKYIYKKMVNGKWRYYYEDDKGYLSEGDAPISELKNNLGTNRRRGKSTKGYTQSVANAKKSSDFYKKTTR